MLYMMYMLVFFFLLTDDDCTDHFTPQQEARMHCYIDLVYKQWSRSKDPAPVPLAPRVCCHIARKVWLKQKTNNSP